MQVSIEVIISSAGLFMTIAWGYVKLMSRIVRLEEHQKMQYNLIENIEEKHNKHTDKMEDYVSNMFDKINGISNSISKVATEVSFLRKNAALIIGLVFLMFLPSCSPKVLPKLPNVLITKDTTLNFLPVFSSAVTAPCNEIPLLQPFFIYDSASNTMVKYWKDKYDKIHYENTHRPAPITVSKSKEEVPIWVPDTKPCKEQYVPYWVYLLIAIVGALIGAFLTIYIKKLLPF